LQDQGFEVVAIAGQDPDALVQFGEQTGITFPVLYDEADEVYGHYATQAAFFLASYPQDWVIAPGGEVVYINNRYEPDEIGSVLERYLP
jgi:peroxiredoxin